jgi:3'-phosphoadenosine 5'-phosphosulfate sulfotransferase (PAPS reductase)/FAD synthetase
MLDVLSYDHYVVCFSGGKDSTAMFLHLLDLGVPKEKIELWHHLVDGNGPVFMDWECTEDYCRQFAKAFGVRIYFSWKEGGFEREMLRKNAKTAPTTLETPLGLITRGGKRGKESTRLKFPQVAADLTVRWCSAYLKRDVYEMGMQNQERFRNSRTLVLTGERAQESSARANYKYFERSRVDRRYGRHARHIDHCRIIHQWKEEDVWGIIQRHGVIAHPCYYIGYSRCSCKFCIFGDADQFASSTYLSPANGRKIMQYEQAFGTTIKRNTTVIDLVEKGGVYQAIRDNPEIAQQAIAYEYTMPIFTTNWTLPAGAYGRNVGPT